jgi:galactose mutarotase-like enzyme
MFFRKSLVGLTTVAVAFAMTTGCKKASPAPEQSAHSTAAASAVPEVGGEPVVKVSRAETPNLDKPQFLSLTVMPGRGMNVYQITANVPGLGEIPVLWAPSLEEVAQRMNGGPQDEDGNASFTCCGAFLVPYPNRILGKVSPDGKTITTSWHGHKLVLPANWHNTAHPTEDLHAMHGLILNSQVQDVQTHDIPGGKSITATLDAGDFGGHWLSKTDLHWTLSITADAFDAEVTATNVGKEAEPIAIGWHPYFHIPSEKHAQALLHVPGLQYAQINNYNDVFPTGKLIPVKGTNKDFLAADGKPLDHMHLDDNWSKLQRTNGAVDVTLTDPASDYGVIEEGLSPEIKTVQVYTTKDAPFAAIEEQFNFADPFGKEWHGMDTGMVTLQPGKSVTWHVRVQLFQPSKTAAAKK